MNNALLFPEYRLSVYNQIPIKFLSHSGVTIKDFMNFILREELPEIKVKSFKDTVDKLFRTTSFTDLSSEDKYRYLSVNYPEFSSWFDTVVSGGKEVWDNVVKRQYEEPDRMKDIQTIVKYFSDSGYYDKLETIEKEISSNFKIRRYKISGTFEGIIDEMYDSLNITDKCRQIVLVKPQEDKIVYKLSNNFDDKLTKVHAQRSLIDIPSRKNKINNYIGMTFTKNSTSNKVVTVIIEEGVPKTKYDTPPLNIVFENLEDIDGEVVMGYFMQTITERTGRGKYLKEKLSRVNFNVFDIEIYSDMYNKDFVRHSYVDLATKEPLRKILFTESSTRVDDQRIILRGIDGRVQARADFQEKYIVWSSDSDLFNIFNLISLFVAYSYEMKTIKLLSSVEIPKWSEKTVEMQESGYEMDVIEIGEDGERILKKARFFDSVFKKVCNKPENQPTFGKSLDVTNPDIRYDYFPPAKLIKKLTETGKYEFPRYQTQKVPVQTYYGEITKGGKKKDKVVIRVLGKRRIPRERRDEMATNDNIAHIFGYFPCVITMDKKNYNENVDVMDIEEVDEDEVEEGETKGMEYVYDETKDEIPPGRFGKTRLFFFDLLKTASDNEILRTGVQESLYSLYTAAVNATGKNGDEFSLDRLLNTELRTNPKILQAAISQFPDSKSEEIKDYIETSSRTFMDSKYLVNILGEYLDVNIVVMTYNTDNVRSLEYALYECPHGSIPSNIFDQLNPDRRTVVLLRRNYQTIYDQYDFLVERTPLATLTTFDTNRVKQFLKTKVSFIDIIPDIADGGKNSSVVNLAGDNIQLATDDPLKELFQVIDTTGNRVGTVFKSDKGNVYPCIHLTPLSVMIGLRIAPYIDLIKAPRPPIESLIMDLGITEFTGVGYTRTLDREFITSIMVDELIFLCNPVQRSDFKNPDMLTNVLEIETPDPYVFLQFSGKNVPQSLLLRRIFADTVSYFLLQVIFLEMLERYVVKNTFKTSDYYTWKRDVLMQVNVEKPTADNIDDSDLYRLVGDIKQLRGYLRPGPIKWIMENRETLGGISQMFSPNGNVLCFSRDMYDKLLSQMDIMETIIPIMGIERLIPKSVYFIRNVHNNLAILSLSPMSVNGIDTRAGANYIKWQETCRTSFENTNVYDGIYKFFFNMSKNDPIIGFHANNQGSGLWVVKSTVNETLNSYPVINADVPAITYLKEREFNVFLPEDPDNKLTLSKLTV